MKTATCDDFIRFQKPVTGYTNNMKLLYFALKITIIYCSENVYNLLAISSIY